MVEYFNNDCSGIYTEFETVALLAARTKLCHRLIIARLSRSCDMNGLRGMQAVNNRSDDWKSFEANWIAKIGCIRALVCWLGDFHVTSALMVIF